jgi:hypothetical protein
MRQKEEVAVMLFRVGNLRYTWALPRYGRNASAISVHRELNSRMTIGRH